MQDNNIIKYVSLFLLINVVSLQCMRGKTTSGDNCTDSVCTSCPNNKDICLSCCGGYFLDINNNSNCIICNSLNAQSCQSINNCINSTSSSSATVTNYCGACPNIQMNSANACAYCSTMYRNCWSCNTSQCTGCHSGYALNISSGSRLNIYLDKQCIKCDFPYCRSCTSGPRCFNCVQKYFNSLSTNYQCRPCSSPCYNCSLESNKCTSCQINRNQINISESYNYNISFYRVINYTCLPCDSHPQTNGCETCSLNANTNIYYCFSCLSSFILSNRNCTPCDSSCLSCNATATNCTSCHNNTLILQSNFTCLPCSTNISFCKKCLTTTLCIQCQIGYVLGTPPSSCLICNLKIANCMTCNMTHCSTCMAGFELNDYGSGCLAKKCDTPCLSCNFNSTDCISCIQGYFLNSGSTCLTCTFPCVACNSSSVCTKCHLDYKLVSNTCQNCTLSNQFYNNTSQNCQTCPDKCLTCSWTKGCLTCEPMYSLKNMTGIGECLGICGDKFVQNNQQCDLGLGIKNDGCTDDCKIQQSFTCNNVSNTTIVNGVSIATFSSSCSYIGLFQVKISGCKQSIDKNSVNIQIKIQPYLSKMPKNNDTQAKITSFFALNGLLNVNQYNIKINEELGIVFFLIDYNKDLQGLFTIDINFPIITDVQFNGLSTLSVPFDFNNIKVGQAGKFYPQQQRKKVKVIYNWSLILSFSGLGLMLVGVFGNELAALQSLLICQNIYILLLFKNNIDSISIIGLQGLRLSMGIKMGQKYNYMSSQKYYQLSENINNFSNNFNINLILFIIPIIVSIIFLIKKLYYKHLVVMKQRSQHVQQIFRGQIMLYFSMANFIPLCSYTYLYYCYSNEKASFWDSFLIIISILITLYSFYNIFYRPQLIGMFRNSFKNEGDYYDNNIKLFNKYKKCIQYRPYSQKYNQAYRFLSINYFTIYLVSTIISLVILIILSNKGIIYILIYQVINLIFLALVRPYFSYLQKLRSVFTCLTYIIGLLTIKFSGQQFILPYILMTCLTVNYILSIASQLLSIIYNIKRRCNDKLQIVKQLFNKKTVKQQNKNNPTQKQLIKQLIFRYQDIQMKNMNISDNNQLKNCQEENINKQEIKQKQNNKKQQQNQKQYSSKSSRNNINQKQQNIIQIIQNDIIQQQQNHLRYQRGLQFFQKYGEGQIDKQLIQRFYKLI